LTIAV